ncbi:MAG: hypothetical protein WBB82_06665 [Limnothrix sp.]
MRKSRSSYLQAIIHRVTKRARDKAHAWSNHHDLDTYAYLRHGVRDAEIVLDSYDDYIDRLKAESIIDGAEVAINCQQILRQMLASLEGMIDNYRRMPGDDGLYQLCSVEVIKADLQELIATSYQPSATELAEAAAYLEKFKK